MLPHGRCATPHHHDALVPDLAFGHSSLSRPPLRGRYAAREGTHERRRDAIRTAWKHLVEPGSLSGKCALVVASDVGHRAVREPGPARRATRARWRGRQRLLVELDPQAGAIRHNQVAL